VREKEYWLARLEIRVEALKENDQETLDALDNERDNHRTQKDDNSASNIENPSLSKLALVLRVLHTNDQAALDTLAALPEFSRSALFHMDRKHLLEARIDLNQKRYYGGLSSQEGIAVLGYDMQEDGDEFDELDWNEETDEPNQDCWEAELEESEKKGSKYPPGLLVHDWYKWETVRDQALTLTIKSVPRTSNGRIDWTKKPKDRLHSIIGHCIRYRMMESIRELPESEQCFALLYRGWLRPETRKTIEQELLDGQTQEDFEEGADITRISVDEPWMGAESDDETMDQVVSRSEIDADGRWQGQWSRTVLEDACLELAAQNGKSPQEIYDMVTAQKHDKDKEADGKTQLQAMAAERGISYGALRKRRERYIEKLKAIIGDDPRKYTGTLVW
jgi:hypothetical protein